MDARDLLFLYDLNHGALHQNAAGLSHEDSVRPPQPAGNCLNWVLGHIVATRHPILKLVKQDGVWPEETVNRYRRGSAPLAEGDAPVIWQTLIEDFDRTQERLREGLARITAAELAGPGGRGPTGDLDVAGRLAFLNFHEAYHIGQIGLLRRLAGQDGAIR